MKPDEFFGSVADDVHALGPATLCPCGQPVAHGYLMCWDCRDRLNLKTEGKRPPKEATPVTPKTRPWNSNDLHTLKMNAHLGVDECARLLERNKGAVQQFASASKVSLRKRPAVANAYLAEHTQKTATPRGTTVPGCLRCHGKAQDGEDGLCHECRMDDNNKSTETTTIGVDLASGPDHTSAELERSVLEAEDEHRIIEERVAYHTGRTTHRNTLLDQADRPPLTLGGLITRFEPAPSTNAIQVELIDTRLRLICATLESNVAPVPASVRVSVEDNVERIRELVTTLAGA